MTMLDAPTAAQLLVQCLENEGVEYVFGIPGEENIHLIDALAASSIRFILARHEQGASFMADMYGRLTGRAGVCLATLGPGAINLLLGTADATTDSAPLVALSAQVGLNRIYKESHQSVDLVGMFKPVTKWAALIPSAEAIPEMVRSAFKLAQTERPGAVYLALPQDIEASSTPIGLPPLAINVVRDSSPSVSPDRASGGRPAGGQETHHPGGAWCRARSGARRTRPLLGAAPDLRGHHVHG